MTITDYIQQFSAKALTVRKQSLESTKARLEAELADTTRDYSAVQAAIALKSYGLKPGDVIEFKGFGRLRIEADSVRGMPQGLPVDADGSATGRTILLYDIILAGAKKVTPC